MSREREIHKIDNYLIRFGWIALVFGLIGVVGSTGQTEYRLERPGAPVELVSSTEDEGTLRRMHPDADITAVGVTGPDGTALWLLAAAALMLGSGYYVRRKENRTLAVWDILDHAVEVRVDDLTSSTGLTREQLRETLAVVNAQPGAFYVWDTPSDTIVDGRLRKRVVQIDRCSSCGAGVSVTVTLDLASAPACRWCGGPVTTGEDINRMRLETLSEIRDAPGPDKPFSVWIFVLLLLVFWPAAVGYALWKGGVLDSLMGKLGVGVAPPRA